MVEMINQKKKFYAEKKAKARRSKPMAQLKTKFEKLVKSIENFVPIETDERVKRQGVQLEQKFSKKQKTIEIDIKNWLVQSKRLCILATPEQTATGKEISNSLTADSLLKTIRLSMHLVTTMKH
ncbi:hypothetical protein Tco_0321146 [Tanacetum coccineum]